MVHLNHSLVKTVRAEGARLLLPGDPAGAATDLASLLAHGAAREHDATQRFTC